MAQNSGVSLSKQDVDFIGRVVATEVPGYIGRKNPEMYGKMVEAVVDTITNRVAHSGFPNTVKGVVEQHHQFSKIAGPPSVSPYGTIAKTPAAPSALQSMVEDHLAERALGKPSTIGNMTHYANPNFSTKTNLGWISQLSGPTLGIGKSVHNHGIAPGFKGSPEYSVSIEGMQKSPIDTAQFNMAGIPTPEFADRTAQFSPVQVASLDPTAGFFAAAAQTPEATAKGVMNSGILSPAVTVSPTSTNLTGLLSPSPDFTAPAQLAGVAPHSVTTTNPAGIDGVARSTGLLGSPTPAQRSPQVAGVDPGFLDGVIDAIDVPGSASWSRHGVPEAATAVNTGVLSTPQSNPATREAMGFLSSMAAQTPATGALSANPETYGPTGAWQGVDMSNTAQQAIGPDAGTGLAEQYASYSPSKGAPSTGVLSAPAAPQRSWGPAAGPSQEVDTFADIGKSPVGLLSAYSQMAGSMPAGVTNLSGMSVAPDPHTPDPAAATAPATVGAPTNIAPGMASLGPAKAATLAAPQTSFKDIAKGVAKGAVVGGLPGAVIGGLLAANPGVLSGARGAAQSALGGAANAIGGFFSRSPDYAGIAKGAYGAGGMPGNGTYGVNGTSRGMGGFEQFGSSYVGPGSGGWADAGQGFGRGSAASPF